MAQTADGESSGVQQHFIWSFTSVIHRILSPPRCKLCPLAGQPTICRVCLGGLDKATGRAEVELSLLFADIRGSTALVRHLTTLAVLRTVDD